MRRTGTAGSRRAPRNTPANVLATTIVGHAGRPLPVLDDRAPARQLARELARG